MKMACFLSESFYDQPVACPVIYYWKELLKLIRMVFNLLRKWTPNSYLKRQNFIPDAKSVTSKNLRGGWVSPPPLGSPTVKHQTLMRHLKGGINPNKMIYHILQ